MYISLYICNVYLKNWAISCGNLNLDDIYSIYFLEID